MLVDAEPGKVAVEVLAVLLRLEVAVGDAPVSDGAGHTMHELLDGVLPLGSVNLAIEVLADDDVGRQLAPGGRNLARRLLEEDLAVLPLDGSGAEFPLRRVERAFSLRWAECRLDFDRDPRGCRGSRGLGSRGLGGGSGRRAGQRGGGVESCHGKLLGLVKTGRRIRKSANEERVGHRKYTCVYHISKRSSARDGAVHESFRLPKWLGRGDRQKAAPSACYRKMLWSPVS